MANGRVSTRAPIPVIRRYLRNFCNFDPTDHFWTSYGLASTVLLHYLGETWHSRHLAKLESPLSAHFRSADKNGPISHSARVVEFAEMLHNAFGVTGFQSALPIWAASRDLEAVVAELRVAKLLRFTGVPFRFIQPMGRQGSDYDLEINHPSELVLPADTKAKIEGTKFTDATILKSLTTARKRNLPPNKPGVIFLHINQSWTVDHPQMGDAVTPTAAAECAKSGIAVDDALSRVVPEFLRNTSRVAFVVAVEAPMINFGFPIQVLSSLEFRNDSHPMAASMPQKLLPSPLFGSKPDGWVDLYEESRAGKFF